MLVELLLLAFTVAMWYENRNRVFELTVFTILVIFSYYFPYLSIAALLLAIYFKLSSRIGALAIIPSLLLNTCVFLSFIPFLRSVRVRREYLAFPAVASHVLFILNFLSVEREIVIAVALAVIALKREFKDFILPCVASVLFFLTDYSAILVLVLPAVIYALKMDERVPTALAIYHLILAAAVLSAGNEELANRLAIVAYYCLCMGVLSSLVYFIKEKPPEE